VTSPLLVSNPAAEARCSKAKLYRAAEALNNITSNVSQSSALSQF
jgi:hypothetical protein